MISEVDINDWDFEQLRKDVDVLGDPVAWGGNRMEAYSNLTTFLDEVHSIILECSPRVPALFKPFKDDV